VTTNQILIGIGLILVLAVGAQVLASRLHIPAIIVLLPTGFVAGVLTTDVNPDKLLGPDGALPAGHDILFLVRADGQLAAVTQADTAVPQAGDTIVSLGPVPVAQTADGRSQRTPLPGCRRLRRSRDGGAGAEPGGRLRHPGARGRGEPQVPPSGDERQAVEQRHEDEKPPVPDDE